eukprot:CAMPEP_0180787522 /NCGR_PEP_ID=MMETSP1038_2-20121128/51433_1 /TAXON_ID=632150 /ORGANISM="Azadinium spinosum, Strain 3D9" /LENGTH=84 /DNA_ID=CAMNT_0022824825 /DNA_START=188 /DNA_END=438 /DNA_ORIENTATION=-
MKPAASGADDAAHHCTHDGHGKGGLPYCGARQTANGTTGGADSALTDTLLVLVVADSSALQLFGVLDDLPIQPVALEADGGYGT